ncbi:MAG: hypothetical protein ACYC5O_18305, partial [Anaerolineae bacterium]
SRLWFPAHQSLGRILESDIAADLDAAGYRALSGWHGSETLLLAYAAPRETAAGATTTFAPGVALLASRYTSTAVVGDAIDAEFDWSQVPTAGLSLSLRLVDAGGTVWAARDATVEAMRQRVALLVPWGTPAVPLSLVIVVSHDGRELAPPDAVGGRVEFAVGPVSVQPATEAPPATADLGLTGAAAASADGISLEGVSGLPAEAQQGDDLPLSLWWSLARPIGREYVAYLQALDASGQVVAATEARITAGLWPPTEWPVGALVRDPHALLLPAHTPAGSIRLVAGLLDPVSRQPLALGGRTSVDLGRVQVHEVARSFEPPETETPTAIRFGSLATLGGYTTAGCQWQDGVCVTDAATLDLTLAWQAQAETGVRYRSFVHVLCGNEIVAQSDGQPGPHPTTAWLPGEYVADEHSLDLPAGLCADATMAVGLYDPKTGERLAPAGPTETADGRVLLFRVARP